MTDSHAIMDRAATQRGKTLLKGHTLVGEGMPFRADGSPMPGRWWGGKGGEGAAKCRCGAISPMLPSGAARQKWHRAHKDSLR